MALIACVDLDPFLVDLVRRARPADEVEVLDAAEVGIGGRATRPSAFVMAAGSRGLDALLGSAGLARAIVIADPDVHVAGHPGPVLRRPVEATELQVALARVIRPEARWPRMRAASRQVSEAMQPDGVFAIARIAALTAAIALQAAQQAAQGAGSRSFLLPIVLLAWAALRVWARPMTIGLVTLDVAMAAAAIVLSGGTGSAYLLVAAVVGAEVGYAYPPRIGATLVGVATLVGLVPLTLALAAEEVQVVELVTWGTLIPLSSVAGVLANRIQRSRDIDQVLALRQVNATLERLSRQAQAVTGTLSVSSAVDEALTGLRLKVGAIAGVVLLEDEGAGMLRTVAGGFGMGAGVPGRVLGQDGTVVPADIDSRFPEGHRLVAPMTVGEVERGILVAVLPWSSKRTRPLARQLAALAEEAALAVDNARVFESVRELSVDEERRRLARDLHDGVVQSLVHVGFELDLLRGELDDGARSEVERLRKVLFQTVEEVRSAVNDLRSVRLSDGLGPALRSLAREYGSRAVEVKVDADPVESLSPEAELQLLRIAQEAVSNAMQHGQPQTVEVRLWADDGGVHLEVEDDGQGVGVLSGEASGLRGVGMTAMRERTELLGAHLDVGRGAAGGTCVRIDVPPTERPAS